MEGWGGESVLTLFAFLDERPPLCQESVYRDAERGSVLPRQLAIFSHAHPARAAGPALPGPLRQAARDTAILGSYPSY